MIKLNDVLIVPTIFPDKTSQIWKLQQKQLEIKKSNVVWLFENEAEFIHLAQLKSLLDNNGVDVDLEIQYLPYARQDKTISNESTFALKPFANLLNTLCFNKISILDPHSDIAIDLIDNSIAIYPSKLINEIDNTYCYDLFCYPDKGAVSKYTKIYKHPYVYGEKTRDQLTGNILNYKLNGDVSGKNILIVDDICDGGMTFIILTKDLLLAGANNVDLFVTHGVFSKGINILKEAKINRIFTHKGGI